MTVHAPHRTRPTEPPRSATGAATPVETVWLDLARIAAITAVVLLHAVATVVTRDHTDLGSATWWTANVVDSLVRWCVPVFIMISGALLLAPRREGLRSFYRRRFSRIGIPLVVWSAFYLSVDLFVKQETDWIGALHRILAGQPVLHLYFLFVLAGLYVLTPFLRVFVAHAPTRMLWWAAATAIGLGVADQAISAFAGIGEPNAVTRFLPYVGYYLLGYLLRDTTLGRRGVWTATAVLAASVAATTGVVGATALAHGEWNAQAAYTYDYLSPTVLAMSVALFLLFKPLAARWPRLTSADRDTTAPRRRLRTLADLSFGVFLVHLVMLRELRAFTGIPDHPVAMVATVLAHTAVVLAASLAVTAVLRRVPGLRATV
ncbi:acyltransferase family protein [Thermobifida halotolerans]|uniref:Acyltransferase family protein n=1 Tax=Thermobifida halotolerans TaxID=483545 RepID=A0AA97LYU3_9ACTN|nr:acyltransferase family protein [Thermobifida halotolerans]UOE20511.1 acyltransferase family protein [Thermobifida halotolerans]